MGILTAFTMQINICVNIKETPTQDKSTCGVHHLKMILPRLWNNIIDILKCIQKFIAW